METIFVTYDVLNSLQKECMSFLGSFAKTCMIFGILLNKILLIETRYPNFYFINILLKNPIKKLQKNIKGCKTNRCDFFEFF
jgi:hypothetical protein